MPTYIVLGKWTQKGIENIKDGPKRYEDANKVAKSVGGEIKALYMTMGQYDWVSIMECPNDEAAMRVLLIFGSGGSNRTETLKAFPIEKGIEIIKELP